MPADPAPESPVPADPPPAEAAAPPARRLLIVEDDESFSRGLATPDERATAFANDMRGLLGHDFTLHTVSSDGPAPCSDGDARTHVVAARHAGHVGHEDRRRQ